MLLLLLLTPSFCRADEPPSLEHSSSMEEEMMGALPSPSDPLASAIPSPCLTLPSPSDILANVALPTPNCLPTPQDRE